MVSIAAEIDRHGNRKKLPLTGWMDFVLRLSGAWRRPATRSPKAPVISARLRRRLARDLPNYLLRDIGLEPDNIRQ